MVGYKNVLAKVEMLPHKQANQGQKRTVLDCKVQSVARSGCWYTCENRGQVVGRPGATFQAESAFSDAKIIQPDRLFFAPRHVASESTGGWLDKEYSILQPGHDLHGSRCTISSTRVQNFASPAT